MKRSLFFAALLLSAACRSETDDGDIICKDPPKIPLPDKTVDYCASGEHDGEVCCVWDGAIVVDTGQCVASTCVVMH